MRVHNDVPEAVRHGDPDPLFALHRGGKMQISPTVPIRNNEDPALAYTPGVATVKHLPPGSEFSNGPSESDTPSAHGIADIYETVRVVLAEKFDIEPARIHPEAKL